MNNVFPDHLSAKVACVNAANAHALKLHAQLTEIFRPLVGCKIRKKDGSFLESVKKLLPTFQDNNTGDVCLRVVPGNTDYRIAWNIYANTTYRDAEREPRNTSYQTAVNIGDVERQQDESWNIPGTLLKSLYEPATGLRTDYDADTIRELRAAHKQAYDAERAALAALYPFGEYDR